MRTEACACGGCITAPSLRQAGPYVEAHNASLLHRTWRALSGLARRESYVDPDILAELIPAPFKAYRDPRRRPTAGTASRDVSGNTPSASAGGEGAA